MNVVLVGASSGMGLALARRLAERGDALVLMARREEALQPAAVDCQVRGAKAVHPVVFDLSDAPQHHVALDRASAALGRIDAVVVTAAAFGLQEDLEEDTERLARLLDLNVTKTILFCEEARRVLLAQGGGTLAVFSSVAGDASRKPVGLYGATKAAISHYVGSLDLRFGSQGLRAITVKPGFVKTEMTEGLQPPPFAGEPDQVAEDVLKALDRGTAVVYTPGIWRWVMLVIRHLPRFVMRRVGF